MFKGVLNFIDKYRQTKKLKVFKQCLGGELKNLSYYSEGEKKLLKKPILTMKKKEYSDYLELLGVVKASAYAEAMSKLKSKTI